MLCISTDMYHPNSFFSPLGIWWVRTLLGRGIREAIRRKLLRSGNWLAGTFRLGEYYKRWKTLKRIPPTKIVKDISCRKDFLLQFLSPAVHPECYLQSELFKHKSDSATLRWKSSIHLYWPQNKVRTPCRACRALHDAARSGFTNSSHCLLCTAHLPLLTTLSSACTSLFHTFVSQHIPFLSPWDPLLLSYFHHPYHRPYSSFRALFHIPLSPRLLWYPQAESFGPFLFCACLPHSFYTPLLKPFQKKKKRRSLSM